MLEQVEQYRPHVIAALTEAASQGLTVKELCGTLGLGEQAIRRCLAVLVVAGVVREFSKYQPGVRGAVPRAYSIVARGVGADAAPSGALLAARKHPPQARPH
ncbi:hypothetical protein QEG98_40325 [Myxococcus sp. MxC21-1]|uniref:hypothetical protein n=1 Tax=Myxococcus sp. MxC21-1 TaxID=3041439 RepID=UPI00292E7800|nr:hypothetical protein [Myxococcus sp. MxC21-1]WNZ66168.1 hypothetical protein QEG98_40325 [Myxococcus sp. MxC21-1]